MRRVRRPLLALIALLAALGIGYGVRAVDTHHAPAPPQVSMTTLPPQVAITVHRIELGQRMPYPEDGATFHNFEHELPAEPDGYYREYTVPTPGSPDRGARRVITGRGGQFYYTGDHYASFVRLTVPR